MALNKSVEENVPEFTMKLLKIEWAMWGREKEDKNHKALVPFFNQTANSIVTY